MKKIRRSIYGWMAEQPFPSDTFSGPAYPELTGLEWFDRISDEEYAKLALLTE